MATSLIRTLYVGTRAVQTVVKDAGRARAITTILAKYGFAALLDRRRARTDALGDADEVASRLVPMLEELGPTFVKFGQILSTRPDIVPDSVAKQLEALQDHVRPLSYDEVSAQIKACLGGRPEELFARFDEAPLASASIAQVHTAKTKGGDDVVVKVQRPRLRETIDADLSLLRFFTGRIVDVYPDAVLFGLDGMVSEFEKSLSRELDFNLEANNIERFRENFRGKDHIHIPKVNRGLSGMSVLTMERIFGEKLTELPKHIDKEHVANLYLVSITRRPARG